MSLGDLESTLHTDEINSLKLRLVRSLPVRVIRAIHREVTRGGIYGHQWGDPDIWTPLRYVRDNYVLPFVNPEHTAVDIGCGGGRWTYYLLGFKNVYAVDYYEDLLVKFRKTFGSHRHVKAIRNNGTDFPGIAPRSVDYILSFGCFGHINQRLIDGYLGNIKTILKPGGNAVIHYSDKNKPIARHPAFADNTPEQMRAMVLGHGFTIVGEDIGTMWNGGIIHFTLNGSSR